MNEDMFGLKGKVAVVTGGGGVLGGAMAGALAARGAAVAVIDIRAVAAAAVSRGVVGRGGRAIAVPGDALDGASLAEACRRVCEELGGVDILVNAAGGNAPAATTAAASFEAAELSPASGDTPATFFDLPEAAVRSVLDMNFLGTFLACQAFGRAMAERGGGAIVNIASMSALRPLSRVPAYSAAKAAVVNFTQWLATHLAPLRVRVNAVAPGFFLTEQNRFLLTDARTGGPTARGAAVLAHTPMGRFGAPGDLAGALVWLASDASAFVTGAVVPVDGGFSAFSGV